MKITKLEKITIIGYLICRMMVNSIGDWTERKANENIEERRFKIRNDNLIIREVTNLWKNLRKLLF